jgi:cobalt-zinc-cadmium efflux system protein
MSSLHIPHDRNHGHGHHRGHNHVGHSHGSGGFGRAFLVGTILNTAFVLIEGGYGLASGSMALLADAGHNLSDVLGLIVAGSAAALSARPPSRRFTYGLGKSSVLAALFNASILLAAIGAIIVVAIHRLGHPQPISGGIMIAVAGVGILVNTATALMFVRGRKSDINVRGAFLHMAADAAVSAGVVVAGLIILKTGWLWLDPAVSLAIALVVLAGTWGLLRDSLSMSLDAVPSTIDPHAVEQSLAAMGGVAAVHDLHIWPLSTTGVALTCHLIMPSGHPGDGFLHRTAAMLHDRFDISHATIQIEIASETEAARTCRQAPAATL